MKILILNTTHIGTTLCDFPLISRVRKNFNDANITVLLVKRNGVLKPYIEKEFNCNVEILDHNFLGINRYKTILHKIRTQWKMYDLGICSLEPRKTDHLLLWALCKNTIAYVENNWHGKLINRPVKYIKETTKHRASKALEVFSNIPLNQSEWPCLPSHQKKSATDGKLRLLISMQNNRKTCTLSNQKLAEILTSLHKHQKYTLVVNDVAEISDESRKLISALKNIDIECCPTKNFSQFVDLVGSCDCCLLGEGGTSHVAAWQQVPQVVLFGQEDPLEWGPLSNNSICLQCLGDVNRINSSTIVWALVNNFEKIEKSTSSCIHL